MIAFWSAGQPQPLLLRDAAEYISRILAVMGLSTAAHGDIGLGDTSHQTEDSRLPGCLDAFASYRNEVRTLARQNTDPAHTIQHILQASDR